MLGLRSIDYGQSSGLPGQSTRYGGAQVLERFSLARVLIIDDSSTNISLLEKMLTGSGLRSIHSATDPRDALARLDDIDPDLVLLDLHMPHIDGYEMLAQLSARAGGAYVPVLVLTADTSSSATHRALALGARDFLTKPFDMVEVTLRVHNLLETRYLYTALRRQNLLLGQQLSEAQEPERAAEAERQVMRQQVDEALRSDSMRMLFQPVYDLGSGDLVGCEALARLPIEPVRGPDRWFADAAAVGLGARMELAAIGKALKALDVLPAPMFLAINASPGTLLSADLTAMCLARDCSRLVLELTEHVPIEDYQAVHTATARLRERGTRLAVDDTGAGYAGFQHLLGIRPDVIKLDGSLTRGVDADPARRALASALVTFTETVGATLIAEGVETADELATLQDLNVQWAQGYHLGRPQQLPGVLEECATAGDRS
jgi:EAL domain-containing protein (putative c-di-GMP-specific phosphodiesterase class I)/DNA-binding NarL/FixJ family response regulator